MSKKKTTSQSNSTTLSTRFDQAELEVLKKAAETKKWSLSQLIRFGAYEKAANILNASGEGGQAVRGILAKVVRQLFEAKLLDWHSPEEAQVEVPVDKLTDEWLDNPWISFLDHKIFESFLMAVRRLGSELEPLLSDEHLRMFAENKPLEKLAELLHDTTPSETAASSDVDERTASEPKPPSDQKQRKPKKREIEKPGR